jgi:hypothetical protein
MGLRLCALALAPLLLASVAAPARAAPAIGLRLSATYEVAATLNHKAGTIVVTSTATITNGTDESVTELGFNLLPARVGQAVLGEALVDVEPVTATVNDQTVTVPLPVALEPDQSVKVTLSYSAVFATAGTVTDKAWLFAKLNGIIAAYRWIPWLSRPVPYDRPNGGEPFVTATSPEVRVRLTSERKLLYATSGRRESISKNGLTQTFVARQVRDFNFTTHPGYSKLAGRYGDTKVVVFYRGLPAKKMLKWTIRALDFYTQKLGPYAYPTLMVAETGGGNAMESPGLIWLPRNTYSSSVPYLVSHEVAHQWFYAMVGSDAADQPFADEAVAEFLSRTLLASFPAIRCSRQELDRTIWEYSSACYSDVVYVQGSRYINAYRKQVGDVAFWSGMRTYVETYRLGLGGIREFWDMLDLAAGLSAGHATRFPRYF